MKDLKKISCRCWSVAILLAAQALGPAMVAEGDASELPDPGPPAWLEVEPVAIQRNDDHVTVEVGGIPQGGVVKLQVLQDCNGDGMPELYSVENCRSPLYERDSVAAGSRNIVVDRLAFDHLAKNGVPRNTSLWLRVSRPGSQQARQVLFGLVDDSCSLWESVIEAFLGGDCNPHLAQALRQHR